MFNKYLVIAMFMPLLVIPVSYIPLKATLLIIQLSCLIFGAYKAYKENW